jgi:hypothetical protein
VEVRFNKVSCLAREYPHAFALYYSPQADLLVVSPLMVICLGGGGGGGGGLRECIFYVSTQSYAILRENVPNFDII